MNTLIEQTMIEYLWNLFRLKSANLQFQLFLNTISYELNSKPKPKIIQPMPHAFILNFLTLKPNRFNYCFMFPLYARKILLDYCVLKTEKRIVSIFVYAPFGLASPC